jgi:hypothetical protein
MDDADPGLESRTQPVYHPVRGQDASALNPIPFTQNSGHPRKLSYALIEYSENAQSEDLHIPIGTHEALRTLANLRDQSKHSTTLPDDPKHTTPNNAWNRYL